MSCVADMKAALEMLVMLLWEISEHTNQHSNIIFQNIIGKLEKVGAGKHSNWEYVDSAVGENPQHLRTRDFFSSKKLEISDHFAKKTGHHKF